MIERRFKTIDETKFEAYQKLREEKNLTHEDIILILQTVMLNPDTLL